MGSDDALGKVRDPVVAVIRWAKSRPPQQKAGMLAGGAILVRASAVCVHGHPVCQCTAAPNRQAEKRCMLAANRACMHLLPQLLLILWRTIRDHNTLFIFAEVAHFLGIGILAYKLQQRKSVSGAPSAAQSLNIPCPCSTCANTHGKHCMADR